MSPPRGLVADVVPFSWVDGPGNRFVVFLQGCNLDCVACHNPHTIPRHSSRARDASVDDILAELRPVTPFLAGVTVSGGEATVQAPFVRALFEALAADDRLRRLTRFVDSNGAAAADVWDELLPVTEGVMLDLKALDPELHRRLTGSDNAHTLNAIAQVSSARKLYETRLLLVPGVNDDAATLQRTVGWLLDLDADMRIKVIGFRAHGVRAAGRRWAEPDAERRQGYDAQLRSMGVRRLEVV